MRYSRSHRLGSHLNSGRSRVRVSYQVLSSKASSLDRGQFWCCFGRSSINHHQNCMVCPYLDVGQNGRPRGPQMLV